MVHANPQAGQPVFFEDALPDQDIYFGIEKYSDQEGEPESLHTGDYRRLLACVLQVLIKL